MNNLIVKIYSYENWLSSSDFMINLNKIPKNRNYIGKMDKRLCKKAINFKKTAQITKNINQLCILMNFINSKNIF